MTLPSQCDGEFAFDDVNEALGRGGAELSAALELGGVLGEGGAQRGRRVDDGGGARMPGRGARTKVSGVKRAWLRADALRVWPSWCMRTPG